MANVGDGKDKLELLKRDFLEGQCIAVSVSESEDLARLGLVETHFRLALGEIARCVLTAGGKLAYGGHLDEGGYTAFLVRELQRFSRRDRPLKICLAWQEHRKMSLEDLAKKERELGLLAEMICLDADGNEIDRSANRGSAAEPILDKELHAKSLTALRRYMARTTQGRILLGGKRKGFSGAYSGIVEEALMSLQYKGRLFLAGGFGGATLDICHAIDEVAGTWFPRWDATDGDPKHQDGLSQIKQQLLKEPWLSLRNGLTLEENLRLAATHRPSEIATLVSLGLGRSENTKG